MEPCVSVVMPSYNRSGLLRRTIPSYLQPEVGELIFVDDASPDDTNSIMRQMCKEEPRIKYIRLQQNSGQPHANNVGVEAASFPYIYFADDDSFLTEGTIGKLLSTIQTYSCDIAAARGAYMHRESETEDVSTFLASENKKEMTDSDRYFDFNTLRVNKGLYYGHPCRIDMCQACFMIKTELAHKIRFDENYKWNAYREETDYLLQAIRLGAVLYGTPNAYQINLPRKMTRGGGAHVHGKTLTLCHTVYNNHYFLSKHYSYLKEAGKTTRSKRYLEVIFILNETVGRIWGRLAAKAGGNCEKIR